MAVRLHKLLPRGIRQRLHRILLRFPYYCEYVYNRRLKKHQKALPKPLAPRMEHQNLSSIAIDPSTNANCLFLTMLPLEIRLEVYTEVFNQAKINRRVTFTSKGQLLTIPYCLCCQNRIHGDFSDFCLLSLPKTCRQIYIESLPLLYARQYLRLSGLSTVVSFSRSILPTRISLLRYLTLNLDFCYPNVLSPNPLTNLTLDETWDIIATQMTGLRLLVVSVAMHSHDADWQYDTEESEKKVLGGLAKCRGLWAFYVVVEHWGQHGQSNGVDEGEGARRWREELERTVMRPRGSVEEIEDKTSAVDLGCEADKGMVRAAHSPF